MKSATVRTIVMQWLAAAVILVAITAAAFAGGTCCGVVGKGTSLSIAQTSPSGAKPSIGPGGAEAVPKVAKPKPK